MRKQAQWMKVVNEAPQEVKDVFIGKFVSDFKKDIVRLHGYKFFGPMTMRTGIYGDDFECNIFTCVLEREIVRVPRFLNPVVKYKHLNRTHSRYYSKKYRRG